ncbi:SMI1/KNR4 family protein [Tenacibaculum discolor]|uniref:SMI1/KNR4 family protein n=1 Tax=Tenacibaculum discolor TaxID=361581 RepID=UPI001FCA12BE|nr:SMI1/KNR4 family protein [Tenacibaculum discolor]
MQTYYNKINMNTVIEKYINGLKKAYLENNGQEDWEHFEKVIHGSEKVNIDRLKQIYPDIPDTLIDLLEYVDGTYWRKYGNEEISFFILGSDVNEYPYYLLSSKEIVENQSKAKEYYSDYIERKYEGVDIDEKITNNSEVVKWLHFSDCMNNGGTSQLFIDFSPSEKGKKGQIVRFLHDPDEFKVIADSFDEYLEKLINNDYNFINEDIMEF